MSDNLYILMIIILFILTAGDPDMFDSLQCNLYQPHCK